MTTSNSNGSLLNKSVTRRHILARLEVVRPALAWKKNRVSAETIDRLEAWLRNRIDRELEAMATVGKTIRFE